jgi:hypothetical protein
MWYYSTEGQQHGPVDETTFDSLIADGVVTTDTFVWQNGMPDWIPLAQARPVETKAILVENAISSTCTICGKKVGAENLIELLGNRVCADCKPIAVQSLREGASLPAKNHTAWREGKKVVAHSQTALPPRCYKCNQDVTTAPLTRKLLWHPIGYYLFIFFNVIVYVIVAMIVRKKATLDIYLCDRHIRCRKNFIIGGWCGAVLGIFAIFGGIIFNLGWLLALGVVVIVAAAVTGIAGARLASPTRIKGDKIWLSGSGKEFLASLPPLP